MKVPGPTLGQQVVGCPCFIKKTQTVVAKKMERASPSLIFALHINPLI
jgi:hypothetical protein